MMLMLLYEKYTPYSLNGIVGNNEAISKLKDFGSKVLGGQIPKPLLLYGPSGVGKTISVKALANTFGFGLILLTASDYRDAETLRLKLVPATLSMGLFNKTNLIVFDEIDELSNQFDKGARDAIVQIIKKSKQPIIFIANDYWDQSISFLRNYVEKVEFKELSVSEILAFVREVAKKEHFAISEDNLRRIAEQSNGDMRAALNDLEFIASGSKNAMEYVGIRNQKLEIFQVLDRIFYTRSFEIARQAFAGSDIDLDMLIKWVDENVPNRYQEAGSIYRSYYFLALSSTFLNKAERLGYYSLLRYASILASSGVSLSNVGYVKRLAPYQFPSEVKYLSQTKESRLLFDSMSGKLSKYVHASKRKLVIDFISVFKIALEELAKKKGKQAVEEAVEDEFGMTKEEAELLIN